MRAAAESRPPALGRAGVPAIDEEVEMDGRKWQVAAFVLAGAGVLWVAARVWKQDLVALASRAALETPAPPEDRGELAGTTSDLGRRPVEPGSRPPERVELPGERGVPTNERELAELVAWMRSLGHEELLRLSNAEFDFEQSELVEMLQGLRGPWVLQAMGDLAVAETDPLLQAILVEGLFGSLVPERLEDARALPILDTLMARLGRAADDPHDVARNLTTAAYMACARNDGDYVRMMSAHLETSDNPGFLMQGYLFMGSVTGGEAILAQVLTGHPSAEGRMGALEGLRKAALDGRVPPAELTALGLSALDAETSERNRLLLYEMMVSAGGAEGLDAVERIVREGDVAELDRTVELLAMEMEPARALALFHDVLAERELDDEAKQALYDAMGLVPGEEGADFLLGLARNGELDDAERLAGLRGLRNRPVDERLAGELRNVFDTAEDTAMRAEALRMLVRGETEGAGLDLRGIAALDDDPALRAEALKLAAMQGTPYTREWLEERLHLDDSLEVKAAALGALVYQAHYTGEGEAVLGYLARAREFTDDEEALALIAEGERMVQDHDPRRLDLELAEEAELWSTVAQYTDGPAARAFERQARQLSRLVEGLKSSASTRRAAR